MGLEVLLWFAAVVLVGVGSFGVTVGRCSLAWFGVFLALLAYVLFHVF